MSWSCHCVDKEVLGTPSPEKMDISDSTESDHDDDNVTLPDSSHWAWSHLDDLCLKLPGRKNQIQQILTFCGKVKAFKYLKLN